MADEQVIGVGGMLMIRRVYSRLRSEGLPMDGDPRRLAANIIYLYRIGVRDENQLLALAPHIT